MIAYAAPVDAAKSMVAKVNDVILFPLITLLLTVALVIFLYGCFQFVVNASNPGERSVGKKHIIWGIVGMLIMLSAMSILSIAAGTFNLSVPRFN